MAMDCTLAEPLYIHKQEKLILLSIKMLRINHGSKRRSDYPNHPAACKMAACYLEITTMSQHLLIIDPQNDFCDHHRRPAGNRCQPRYGAAGQAD
jgi:hypothetical protein